MAVPQDWTVALTSDALPSSPRAPAGGRSHTKVTFCLPSGWGAGRRALSVPASAALTNQRPTMPAALLLHARQVGGAGAGQQCLKLTCARLALPQAAGLSPYSAAPPARLGRPSTSSPTRSCPGFWAINKVPPGSELSPGGSLGSLFGPNSSPVRTYPTPGTASYGCKEAFLGSQW